MINESERCRLQNYRIPFGFTLSQRMQLAVDLQKRYLKNIYYDYNIEGNNQQL